MMNDEQEHFVHVLRTTTNQEEQGIDIEPKTLCSDNCNNNCARCIGVVALSILLFVMFLNERQVKDFINNNTDESVSYPKIPAARLRCRHDFCPQRFQQLRQHFGGFDFTQTQDMLHAFRRARAAMHADLKEKYGPTHFQDLFIDQLDKDNNNTHPIMQSSLASKQRFERQLQLKMLKVIQSFQYVKDDEECECDSSGSFIQKSRANWNSASKSFTDFIWSTGGNFAAAGHGNFYNESYTSYLEHAVQPVLASIGIHFVGRNYAMGGVRSAPELALCQEAVFGTDADIITYDFGMTDAAHDENVPVYGNRIGLHSNHPTTVWIRIQPYISEKYIQPLDKLSLTEFWIDEDQWTEAVKKIPDMNGMTQEQMDDIPEFLRYYKCNDRVENGEPCVHQKYNLMTCADRPHKSSWHPGWKVNAHYGHFMAVWLVESFYHALLALVKDRSLNSQTNVLSKIAKLQAVQDQDSRAFAESSFPETPIKKIIDEEMIDDIVKPSLLHRVKSICRISLLPSETRARGIMNNHNGEILHAVPKNEADKTTAAKAAAVARQQSEDDSAPPAEDFIPDMRLVNDPNQKFSYKCEIPLQLDFKDFFYTNENDGWTRLVLPNEAEAKAYNTPSTKKVGVLVLCFVSCDWGKCPRGELQVDEFAKKQFELVVNDVPVKELVKMGDHCAILKNEKGYIFEPRRNKVNDIEQYELKAKVHKQSYDQMSYIRITSMILL